MTYANRGMGLETLIDYANAQYAARGIATIQKVPTPVKVTKLINGRIKDGFYEKDSTVDYMGDMDGRSICFEAKSSKEETSFPLKNLERHQIDFMRSWKGITFVLVELSAYKEIYFVPSTFILSWWDRMQSGGRKSIPMSDLRELQRVTPGRGIILDYLKPLGG